MSIIFTNATGFTSRFTNLGALLVSAESPHSRSAQVPESISRRADFNAIPWPDVVTPPPPLEPLPSMVGYRTLLYVARHSPDQGLTAAEIAAALLLPLPDIRRSIARLLRCGFLARVHVRPAHYRPTAKSLRAIAGSGPTL